MLIKNDIATLQTMLEVQISFKHTIHDKCIVQLSIVNTCNKLYKTMYSLQQLTLLTICFTADCLQSCEL
jgi:hypothetical protein